ncbi:DUF4236 domain-containing protein [Streptomyces sp. NPDC001941]|uniref:DUF4236 domain-containing protein n=1 Tax=Streptomyces sp. NPDC001941 TaxID=3154659 RepID=UPI00331BA84D
MSFHYHKRITLIPRVLHIEVSNHGWSWHLGGRRAHATGNSHGHRSASVRLPGGFSWSSRRH